MDVVVATEATDGQVIRAKVGQQIIVQLKGDKPKTGWEASAVEGSVRREGAQPGEQGGSASPQFTPEPNAAAPEIGTYSFVYRAVAAGQAEMRFVYVYPGGPIPVPRSATKLVKQVRFTVEVVDAKP
jgi:predicted secreted protein